MFTISNKYVCASIWWYKIQDSIIAKNMGFRFRFPIYELQLLSKLFNYSVPLSYSVKQYLPNRTVRRMKWTNTYNEVREFPAQGKHHKLIFILPLLLKTFIMEYSYLSKLFSLFKCASLLFLNWWLILIAIIGS